MKISFLGQGPNSSGKSVGSVLMNSLSDAEFNKFSCLVAFASLSAINGISDIINNSKQHIKQFTVIVGINHRNTSKEVLEALFGLDIETSIYYTHSPIIFHPKIYLFDGDKKCRIIVGSSNLTKTGLFQNIEASFKIDFTKSDPEGEILLKQIYDYFGSLFDGKTKNVHKLTQELVQDLFKVGIIPDEKERKAQDDKTTSQKRTEYADTLEKLKTLFPAIDVRKPPIDFKTTRVAIEKNTGIRYWKVSTGKGAENWEECKTKEVISINFDYRKDWRRTRYGDLTKNHDKEKIIEVLKENNPKKRDMQASKDAEIIINFFSIKPGDKIIAYGKNFHINATGEVEGEYDFKNEFKYPHIKKVKWIRNFDKPLDIIHIKNQLTHIWGPPTVIKMTEKDWNTIDNYPIMG